MSVKGTNSTKVDRKVTASLPSMITTTASSYKSCDLQELKMAGKRNIVESWPSPGSSPGSVYYYN